MKFNLISMKNLLLVLHKVNRNYLIAITTPTQKIIYYLIKSYKCENIILTKKLNLNIIYSI